MREKVEQEGLVKLANLLDPLESEMLQDLLRQEGIPVLAKDKESGGYLKIYMGYSMFGEDLYVRESDYERAQELMQSLCQNCDAAINEAQPEAFDDAAQFEAYENAQMQEAEQQNNEQNNERKKSIGPLLLAVAALLLAWWGMNF